ncbi:MAG: hypothetical protein LPK07_02565 [Hymenobacteraceae bacterium]|nr:hypothetical protein [Hymenobacteraceae bacterium]MDX5480543.1 hypothetical protein [Hymenobacteraceae bacterium]
MRSFSLLALLILLASCGSDQPTTETVETDRTLTSEGIDSLEAVQAENQRKDNTPPGDTISFEAAFSRFMTALQAGDTVSLNQYIHPEYGLWLIEQPGAVPAFSHFRRIQEVKRNYQNRPFSSINTEVRNCDLQQRNNFPEFDCAWMDQGKSGYAEDGCFYSTSPSFINSDMWKYASLSEQQQQLVQRAQKQVQITVLHTRSSYQFHFNHDGERWRLLFADLRIPCSA